MTVTVVSISGPSGSGKSSLVKAIVKLLPDACSLHFDDYKETTKFPDDLKKWLSDGCNPDDFYTPKMVEDLKSLRKQRNRGVDYRRRAIWQGTNSDVRAY